MSKARSHKELVEVAKASIEAVFSDTSVPQSTTIESLEDLQADIETKLDCLHSE